MSIIKHRRDIQNLRKAAKAASGICTELTSLIIAGNNAAILEELANKLLRRTKSTSPFKQFTDENGQQFGYACCVSINGEVVNGPPVAERVFHDGDMVSVAIGTCVDGIYGKAARTMVCGNHPELAVITATKQLFEELHQQTFKPANVAELCDRITAIAKDHGVRPIADTTGHGIGKAHQDNPSIPNLINDDFRRSLSSAKFQPYQAFVPMPMFAAMSNNADEATTIVSDDGWTITLEHPGISSHWANTCWVNESGIIEVLG
jgi:methionyl aminopeptidase